VVGLGGVLRGTGDRGRNAAGQGVAVHHIGDEADQAAQRHEQQDRAQAVAAVQGMEIVAHCIALPSRYNTNSPR
jgi:hypothetical protein